MKNKICVYDVSPLKIKENYQQAFLAASQQRKDKINELKSEKDKLLCLGADIAIKHILKTESDFDETDVQYDSLGKPFLQNKRGEKAYISLSHSGDFVVCAISDMAVGADVEKIRKVNLKTTEKFSENEKEYILSQECPETAFFRIWTLKESYLKAIGKGIRQRLNSFETVDLQGHLRHCDGLGFFEIKIPGHYVSVCSKYGLNDFEIQFL